MSEPLEDPRPSIDQSSDSLLRRLAAELSTPLLVHDRAVLRQRAGALRRVLPPDAVLLYSLKANPLPPVVAALQAAGCGSEVSSPGELAVALGTGVPPGPVLYTGPGKSVTELRAAVDTGAILSCESAAEVVRLREAVRPHRADPLRVVVRVQPPSRPTAGLSMADGRQFGFLLDEAVEFCRRPGTGVEVLGFHCYLGSQLPTPDDLLTAFAHVVDVVGTISAASGVRPRVVDVGGGFPWPYAAPGAGPDLSPLATGLPAVLAPLTSAGAEVWFESGRALVAAAGRLLTTVRDVKQRSGTTVVVVDAGVNVLGGMSGLGRVLRPSTRLRNLSHPDGETVTVDVVGPLCTPLDRLAVNSTVATPRIGDLLCVDNAGAYATTAALPAFLSRPAAVEVVVDGDDVVEAWKLASGHLPVGLPARLSAEPARGS
ncbi:type III PLP-dependent enzyme [Micromonospora sp. NPDC049230]|uniref:type III PLP-dependent enzyme n=1 Tax=Micromonospora sp. NPDC049230 TaxID=3155502 RepID=UPI0033D109BE